MPYTNTFTKFVVLSACLLALSGADSALAATVESRSRSEASIRTVINGQEVTNIHKVEETTDGSPATVHVESRYHDSASESVSTQVWSATPTPSFTTPNREDRETNYVVNLNAAATTSEQIERIIRELHNLIEQLTNRE